MAAIVTPTLARFGVCEKTLVSLFSRFILVAMRHAVSRIFPDALINEGIHPFSGEAISRKALRH